VGITDRSTRCAWYPVGMEETNTVAASRDPSRQDAAGRDTDYVLSLEEVAERYAKAGHPRTLRTLQRYCANGHLNAQKLATATGDKYLVTPQSVDRHIAQTVELGGHEPVAIGRDTPRQVATDVAQEIRQDPPATEGDKPRQATTPVADMSPDVAQLEREVDRLNDDRNFLREQIKVKDTQIASLLERDRETNILIRGLQEMLTPLLGGPRQPRPTEHPSAE